MKSMKFIIAFFTIWIGLLIIGESKVFYLQNFSDTFTSTTMYEQKGIEKEQMRTDILSAAQLHDVDFFIVSYTPTGTNINYKIYGTENSQTYIERNFKITNTTYNSFFLGNVSFNFNSFEQASIDEISLSTNYYIIGSNDNIHLFKMELINTYAGNHPVEGTGDNNNILIIVIWSMVGAVILIFTLYDIVHQRKENLIRITMGESLHIIVLRNIVKDSSMFLLFLIISYWSLKSISNPDFMFQTSLFSFVAILIINASSYSLMYFYSIKEAFSNSRKISGVLSFNYLIKIVSIIVTTIIISSNVLVIYESYKVYKQKDFFEGYKDYAHVFFRFDVLPLEEEQQLTKYDVQKKYEILRNRENYYNFLFYQKYSNEGADQVLQISFDDSKFNQVSMNKSMEGYVKRLIPSLEKISFKKDVYIFIPNLLKDEDERDIVETMSNSMFFDSSNNLSREIVYYNENISLATNHTKDFYSTSYIKNPVIIFLNIDPTNIDTSSVRDTNYFYFQRMMYNVNIEQVKQFIKEHKLESQTTFYINVWENYEKKWETSKRIIYINLVFTFLILLLEFIIITSIIRLEYQMNALEIAIKKTLGYSIWERNKKLILIPIIITIIAIIGVLISVYIYHLEAWLYLLLFNLILLTLELSYLLFVIKKMDYEKVTRILKGGNV